MEIDYDQALSSIFSRMTEQLAFMFVEPAAKDKLSPPEGECLTARMDFSGILNGTLQLAVPAAMCAEIAMNMLGLDEDDELAASKGMDALKEILNVTCGNLLTELSGDQPIFDLTIPEAASMDAPAWLEFLQQPRTLGFLVEDHPVLLQLRMDGGIS